VRAETVATSGMFRSAFARRRLPAISFPEQSPSYRPSSQRCGDCWDHFAGVFRTIEALHATSVASTLLLLEFFDSMALIGVNLAR
jgi:hypothetical protein